MHHDVHHGDRGDRGDHDDRDGRGGRDDDPLFLKEQSYSKFQKLFSESISSISKIQMTLNCTLFIYDIYI